MANKRIKDLATTATTTASDDFMAVDGVTNGTRKLSAATPAFLTSVTTPSLTSPASTPLTLGTGTSGAAITVLSASNNVGIGTPSPLASLHVQKASSNTLGILERITTSSTVLGESVYLRLIDAAAGGTARAEIGFGYKGTAYQPAAIGYVATSSNGNTMGALYLATRDVTTDSAPTERMRIASTGDVSISSTTAGSSGAGALVVTGGLATGAASYFGGAVTAAAFYTGTGGSGAAEFKNSVSGTPQTIGLFNTSTTANSDVCYGFQTQGSRTCNWLLSRSTGLLEFTDGYQTRGNVRASFDMNTGAATFAGTVSPQQATTAAAPAYVKGAIYFDTTLNKLRVGGATAYETITSV